MSKYLLTCNKIIHNKIRINTIGYCLRNKKAFLNSFSA